MTNYCWGALLIVGTLMLINIFAALTYIWDCSVLLWHRGVYWFRNKGVSYVRVWFASCKTPRRHARHIECNTEDPWPDVPARW